MQNILTFAKYLITQNVPCDGVVGDFTMGNGSDTLFLAQHCCKGKVYAFDIQQQAVDNTRSRLEANWVDNAELILDSHSNLDQYIHEELDGGMFNLGYLPGSDRTVTTKLETTLEAVRKAASLLKIGGVLVIVVYPGHDEGALEGRTLEDELAQLDSKAYDVLLYRLINKISEDCPYILAIERRK